MLKKFLAGTLGASMILTSLAADGFSRLYANKNDTVRDHSTDDAVSDTIVKQLSENTEEPEQNIRQLSNEEIRPEISNVEFDIATGELKVWSKQNVNSKLIVSFISEDDGNDRLDLSSSLHPEQLTVTTLSVDVNKLPEYFVIRAVVADDITGLEISESFTYRYYTRSVQKIADTYATDFDEQYVVNFDDDEKTNFVVLNESTIVAESSESENTIVSADYDTDVFVLENISDTVRNLKSGDRFFAQSDDGDIVAVVVSSINVENDKATILGSDKNETVFDFVKIDTTYTEDCDVDAPENESVSSSAEADDYMSLGNLAVKYEGDSSLTLVDYPKSTDGKELELGDFKVTPNLKIELKKRIVLYFSVADKVAYTEAIFDTPINTDVKVSLTDKEELPVVPKNCYEPGKKLVSGLFLKVKISLALEAAETLNMECEFEPKFGFIFDSTAPEDERLTKITAMDVNTNDISAAVDIEGKGFFGFKYSVDLSFFDVEDIGIKGKIGFNFESTQNLYDSNVKKYQPGIYQSESKEYDAIHTCDACVEGKIIMVADLALRMRIRIPVADKDLYEDEAPLWDENILTADYHMSLNGEATDGTHILPKFFPFLENGIEVGFGKCPHKAYRTTFNVFSKNKDDEKTPIENAKIVITPTYKSKTDFEGTEVYTDANGQAIVYLADLSDPFHVSGETADIKAYGYKIYNLEGDAETNGSFNVTSSSRTVDVVVNGGSFEKPLIQTAPVAKVTTEAISVKQTIPASIPNQRKDLTPVQTVSLGENITGFVYPFNGLTDEYVLRIIGYGEMNNKSCPFENKTKIKEVYIENIDPENGYVITNIGKNLLYECSNLKTIYIPRTITSISEYAFYKCSNLKKIECIDDHSLSFSDIFSDLETVGESAFSGCTVLEIGDYKVNSVLKTIGKNAFENCGGITSLYFPATDVKVSEGAFSGCKNLEKIELEDLDVFAQDFKRKIQGGRMEASVKEFIVHKATSIPKEYFAGGDTYWFGSLETIKLPTGIRSIGNKAFGFCPNLKTITCVDDENMSFSELFKDVETFGESLFYNFSTIGNSKVQIGELRFGEKVKNIGKSAFSNCDYITSVYIPEKDIESGEAILAGCNNLKKIEIENMDVFKNNLKVYLLGIDSKVEELVIKNGTQIPEKYLSTGGYGTFLSLKTVWLPAIESIGTNSFLNCPNIETIYYNGTKSQWDEKVKGNIASGNDIVNECYNEENGRKIVYLGDDTTPTDPGDIIYGDVNGDGKVTLADALAILQFIANEDKCPLSESARIAADCYNPGDGITGMDAIAIQMYDTGDIDTLPYIGA